ncbi:MAG: GLUG motif-containing protein, partial [Anaerolineales bacterium]|nr:GLUG motif-containing protein [Anaerolineales bacterium]
MKTQLLKSISSLLFLAFATSTSVAQTAEEPNGSGTESDPYAIATLNNLYWLSQTSSEWSKHYRQTADIDASATSGWDNGEGFSPIGNIQQGFSGSYDGQYFKVSGLMINRPDYDSVGLFGYTESATIKNLGLTNVSITGNNNVGGLVGKNVNKFPDPDQYASTVTNCYTTGSVRGRSRIGGLVGYFMYSCAISKSYSTCSVIATGERVGGLVGINGHSYITDSYATGSVTGGGKVGGLVGTNGRTTISNSYSTGLVSTESDSVGGLIGNGASTVNNCFWDTETSEQSTSLGGEGKTTSEMKRTGTFISAGWDFESETGNGIENIWDLDMSGVINDGYPYLWYQDGNATSLDVSDAPVLPDGFVIH